jgi:hypothetical protein
MKVFVLKEGKEYNQGVAYLDDGTMVVIDNARRSIGRNIEISVTSVLQTTAGKMIFGRYMGSEDGRNTPSDGRVLDGRTTPPDGRVIAPELRNNENRSISPDRSDVRNTPTTPVHNSSKYRVE